MNRQTLFFVASLFVAAQAFASDGVYVVFDGSGSMWGKLGDGTHKITAARAVLDEFVGQDFGDRELALRAYGHRRKGDCTDTELAVPFASADAAASQIRGFAKGINPKGKTPIGRSLRAALEDMGKRSGDIILISDGIETCDDDPCALVKSWRDKDIAIRVHVVGLGLKDKERAAMQCIADAAGTEYRDAQSADELGASLTAITEFVKSSPPASAWQVLTIHAANAAGERVRVIGHARNDTQSLDVSNNGHSRVPPGSWEVAVGMQTENGNIYRPVSQTVEVKASGSTPMHAVVEEPPSVTAKFTAAGKPQKGSLIYIFQNGNEIGRFRPRDRAYLDPGTYEFRAQPNADNKLSVTATVDHGDAKEIQFEMAQTVRVTLKMVSSESNIRFRSILELWQNGERKYKVNTRATVLPGTYDLRLPLYMTPYVHENLVITTDPKQEHTIEVPVGHATFRYQNADGTPLESRDRRVFLERVTDATYKSDRNQRAGERIPLTEGSYTATGWSRLGAFDPVTFSIKVGEEKEIVLKAK